MPAMRRLVSMAGFAWQTMLGMILIFAALIALSVPYVAHQRAEEQRQQTVRILATIAMAKAAYANDNDIVEGRDVTLEQILGKTKFLKEKPVFPYPDGELMLEPVGKLPLYKLKDGTVISPLLVGGTDVNIPSE